MSTALLLTVLVFTTYDVRGYVAFRIYNPFSVTMVGFYIFVFLSANVALSLRSLRPSVLVAAPATMLAGYAIVAGPLYGWLIKAGVLSAIAVSYALAGGTFFTVFLLPLAGPLIGPVTTGCLTGLLVHCATRAIAGQSLWNHPARREALTHCLGFIIGAYIIYLAVGGIDKKLWQLRDAEAGPLGFVGLLWPIFLGAPTAHLVCLSLARHRWGWPQGRVHPKRLLVLSIVLFALIGAGRSLRWEDPALLLTWPARDLDTAQFWKNHPRRSAPLTIGGYQVTLDGNPHSRKEWNRELQQYDFFQIFVSDNAWTLPDVKVSPLEVRLREAYPPYTPVICDVPADHGLLLCRPRGPNEWNSPDDRSVPAYWIKFDYDIYAPPDRQDIVLGHKFNTVSEANHLSVALSGSRSPEISVLLPINRFDLVRWSEAVVGFDQVLAHHLQRTRRPGAASP